MNLIEFWIGCAARRVARSRALSRGVAVMFYSAAVAWAATAPAGTMPSAEEVSARDQAIARGDVEALKKLLEAKPALVHGEPDAKLSPLHQAILRRQTKIVTELLERGADVQVPDSSGRTPLHLAVERADAATVRELLRRKADPAKRDRIGWTPLHHAAAKNRMEIATLLLDSGMDPNFRSELGGTALHEAAASGVVEMVTLLLARGVDPTVRSKPGVTALDLACEYKHPDVIAILEKKP